MPRTVRELGPWFHNLHLPDGTQTAPDHPLGDFPAYKWEALAGHLPDDMRGWRVLDVGCNAGFYSLQLARRGASVVGFEPDEHYLAQARWAASCFDLPGDLRYERRQVYDLARDDDERYDLVLFMGVFYHLRYPLLGLDLAARKARDLLVFQSLMMPDGHGAGDGEADDGPEHLDDLNERSRLADDDWPKMAFIEGSLAGDPTNWWAPNAPAARALLRTVGMRVVAEVGDETLLCRRDDALRQGGPARHASELRAATGEARQGTASP